ncbi:MAG: hypothetical protein JSU82_17980 [Rhodospirillales bacterium]|nr:MAG: hypothetical protein JSU82_17980 [Rhodospirillales bacterium]
MLRHNALVFATVMPAAVLAVAGCSAGPASVESPVSVARADLPARLDPGNTRVVLMPVDIRVSQLTAAGLKEPRADWTSAARVNLVAALGAAMSERGISLNAYRVPESASRIHRDNQLRKLHSTVGGAILDHHFDRANRLPAKRDRLEWTLGRTTRELGSDQNARFALFVRLHADLPFDGRSAAATAQPLSSGLTATPVGRTRDRPQGSLSLVDLRNGDILWFSMVSRDPGDIRTAESARDVVETLMTGFPL